jgi:hypothetical protein
MAGVCDKSGIATYTHDFYRRHSALLVSADLI